MKTAILSVGTEILFGQITNTNTVYLSRELNNMGLDVMYHYTVGDNPERVAEIMELALKDVDMILTTGGLGPTQDDLTKEVACRVFSDELVVNEHALGLIESYFKRTGRKMTENNTKQALMPSRAIVFQNDAGTAPGFALERDGKYIVCMPGPPREMTRMFQVSVKPFLEKMTDSVMRYRILRFYGIGESELETRLLPVIDGQTDPTIATYAKEGECQVRIASKRADGDEADAAVEEMTSKVLDIAGEYCFSLENEDLVQVVAEKLMTKGLTIASAESCTGGLFAAALTDIPGISGSFKAGFVTYSNESKVRELGVNPEALEKYGAVSEETAREMVEGLYERTGCDVCVSVTGIAGPGGGTPEKPVGLVYIGFKYGDRCFVTKKLSSGASRKWTRNHTLLGMLDIVRRNI
ncbi:MAG: competence/damage-inducible protein A [Firmicutes bacterium]|nr:competence/damage-inducible protein A [Bacillota bacterium]